MSDPEYLTLREAATLAGCHIATVRRAIAAGRLTRYISGPDRKGYRLRRTDVERWITPVPVAEPGTA